MRYLIGNRPISSSFVPTSRILFSLKIPLIFFLRYAARFRSNIKRFPKRISEMENKIPKKEKRRSTNRPIRKTIFFQSNFYTHNPIRKPLLFDLDRNKVYLSCSLFSVILIPVLGRILPTEVVPIFATET